MKYKLISFEGIDGVGKSTITNHLKNKMEENQIKVYQTRDPIRNINPWSKLYDLFEECEKIDKVSEALLLLSVRIDNYQRILKQKIENGYLIISDRFVDSWFAYQSIRLSEYFGNENNALNFLISTHKNFVDQGLLIDPNKTIYLKSDPEISIKRVKGISKYEKLEFQKKVQNQYDIISEIFPDRIIKIDTCNKSLEKVIENVKEVLEFSHN